MSDIFDRAYSADGIGVARLLEDLLTSCLVEKAPHNASPLMELV